MESPYLLIVMTKSALYEYSALRLLLRGPVGIWIAVDFKPGCKSTERIGGYVAGVEAAMSDSAPESFIFPNADGEFVDSPTYR